MAEKRWEFELDGKKHAIELEHSTFSNKLFIRVDGRLLSLSPEAQQPKDRNSRHAFRVDGHPCEIVIEHKDRKFVYDLILDGLSNTPEKYSAEMKDALSSDQVKGTRWVISGLFLVIGLGGNWLNWYWAHTKGFYAEELALLMPAIAFIGLYFILFPGDFVAQFAGKFSLRMWVAIVFAFLIGFANMYAFNHGLY
jgi:hypothetical protein